MTNRNIKIIIIFIASITFSVAMVLNFSMVKDFFLSLGSTLWILLSYTLFSIDQWLLWVLPIILFAMLIFARIFKTNSSFDDTEQEVPLFYINRYASWKSHFETNTLYNKEKLKKELARLIVHRYAIDKGLPLDYRLFDDFKNKKIIISDSIQDFLFSDQQRPLHNLKNLVNQISGKNSNEFKMKIEECLTFLEQYMEL